MDWNNYLAEGKSPVRGYAQLGRLEGEVSGYYDLAQLPAGIKVLSLSTPLKKFKLSYSNWDALRGNREIEAIRISDLDHERVDVLAEMPNLKYLHISCNKQDELPDLSSLKALQVLVISSVTRVKDIEFLKGLSKLETLYISDLNHLYDLAPLAGMKALKELDLSNGGMSGVGKPVKSFEPLSGLLNLEYLSLRLTVENRNYDVSPLFPLKKLKHLSLLPRFFKKGVEESLRRELPCLGWKPKA